VNRVKFSVSPDIKVGGRRFSPADLALIAEAAGESTEIELTTLQQLIVEVDEDRFVQAKDALREQWLRVYEVGMVVAIAGQPVPFPMRVRYSGCPNACGESLSKDIGVVKVKDLFFVYVGGETKTLKATAGELLADNISEESLPHVVNRIVDIYRENGKKRERFSHFVRRYSVSAKGLSIPNNLNIGFHHSIVNYVEA
jgi:precorrin-3B C17-methyltransferase